MNRRSAFWLVGTAGGLAFWLAGVVGVSAYPPQAAAANPHGRLAQDCALCHTKEAWAPLVEPLVFDHSETGFPLRDGHARAACRACHQSLAFSNVPTACADCHADPHRAEQGFRCEACHEPVTWSNQRTARARHEGTLFPLIGQHANVDCEACHRQQQPHEYVLTPLDCGACHLGTFEAATSPNHVLAGFSRRCEDCHLPNSRGWDRVSYVHPASYPLRGAHAQAACEGCHAETFVGTPTDCVACHRSDYDGTRDPNHAAAGFPTQCDDCHSTSAWRPAANIDHDRTRFPLTGAHRGLDCGACHRDGTFAGTPTDCVACHRSDYDGTRDPNHVAGGFPTDCEACHSTNAWRPASDIDHNKTRFPLTGAHRGLDCGACHADGRFAGTPRDCVACHRSDYDGTRDPNHAASGFPTDCEACHSTNAWRPADFDHDRYFPIDSGKHRGEWDACSDCHVSPGNFRAFECITCHAHTRSEMDDKHDDVNGYSYNSAECYRCHPRGEAEDD